MHLCGFSLKLVFSPPRLGGEDNNLRENLHKGYFHVFVDGLNALEASTGLVQRSWFNITPPYNPEIVFNSLPNTTTTISNILPYTLYTYADTAYRIQGYWRPYSYGCYNFIVNCSDLYYELIVEQYNRRVKFCDRTEKW